MTDEAVQRLLDGFVASVSQMVPVSAIWVHGSLALGDYVPARSELDLPWRVRRAGLTREYLRTAIPNVV